MSSKIIEFENPTWELLGEGYFQPVENLESGRSYQPDWRWRKVQAYLRAFRGKLEKNEKPLLIGNEKDQLVIDAFIDIAYRDRTNYGIYWSLDAMNSNRTRSGASQIKAMILGRASLECIAEEQSCNPEWVDTFCKLFFDVGRYIDKASFISTLYAPFQTMSSVDDASPASAEEAKERMWMMIGYNLGYDRVREVMYRLTNVTPKDLAEFANSLNTMMSMAKFDYVATMRTFGNARPADFEKSLQYDQTQSQAMIAKQGQQGGNFSDFYARLLAVGTLNLKQLPNNQGTARLMALGSNDPKELDRHFGPNPVRRVNTGVVDFLESSNQIARTGTA